MGVPKSAFVGRDVYLDYDFEDVMFRFEHETGRFFRRFHGEEAENEVKPDNGLLNDAMRFGKEIDEATYRSGGAAA